MAANVAFAGALRFLDFGMPEGASTARGWLIFVSMIMAIMNLIPAKGKRFDSDGMALLKTLFSRSYREAIVARLTFIERLRMFKACFAAGDIAQAEAQLVWMRRACVSHREAKLKAIVDHLGEHVLSGESLEQCTWSPG